MSVFRGERARWLVARRAAAARSAGLDHYHPQSADLLLILSADRPTVSKQLLLSYQHRCHAKRPSLRPCYRLELKEEIKVSYVTLTSSIVFMIQNY